jgi:hypothetical protein
MDGSKYPLSESHSNTGSFLHTKETTSDTSSVKPRSDSLYESNFSSYSKEFENLMQFLAISSGSNIPTGVKIPTFRPSNLPPKDPNEEK